MGMTGRENTAAPIVIQDQAVDAQCAQCALHMKSDDFAS